MLFQSGDLPIQQAASHRDQCEGSVGGDLAVGASSTVVESIKSVLTESEIGQNNTRKPLTRCAIYGTLCSRGCCPGSWNSIFCDFPKKNEKSCV